MCLSLLGITDIISHSAMSLLAQFELKMIVMVLKKCNAWTIGLHTYTATLPHDLLADISLYLCLLDPGFLNDKKLLS
jgi:hypothetical protein